MATQQKSDQPRVLHAYRTLTALLVPGIPFVIMAAVALLAPMTVAQHIGLVSFLAVVMGVSALSIWSSRFILAGEHLTFKTLLRSKTIDLSHLEALRITRTASTPRMTLQDTNGTRVTFPLVPYPATYRVILAAVRQYALQRGLLVDPHTMSRLETSD